MRLNTDSTGRTRPGIAIAVALAELSLLMSPAAAQDIVIRGGRYFDAATDRLLPNSGIVISGGKFLEVGANLSGRDLSKSRVIELDDDDTILPGIFDLHAHYNVRLAGRRRQDETIVNPVIFLASGVTSTFPAGEYDPQPMMELRKRIDRGERIGPRIFNSGPYFGSARRGWNRNASVEDIYKDVDYWAERGVRGFKAKGISAKHLQALIERAHLHGLTVTGHLGSGFRGSVNPRDAILMGIDRIEHFLGGDALPGDRPAYSSLENLELDTPEFRRIVDLFIKRCVYFDATITAYGYYGRRDEIYKPWTDETRYFTPQTRAALADREPRRVMDQFEKIYHVKQKTIKAFFDAGGLITLGTDHFSTGEYLAGFAAHRELAVLVRSGIPPAAAIRIATINGARALGVGELLGSVETGKLADLFVVRGDPLDDIHNTRNIKLVIKAGQVYDPHDLLESVVGKMSQPAERKTARE